MVENLEETLIENMWVFIGDARHLRRVVFFGSILNASLVSLAERQREVATLRVLGYGPWQIGSLLLRESLIVTLVGTLLGMPLGYLLTVLMADGLRHRDVPLPGRLLAGHLDLDAGAGRAVRAGWPTWSCSGRSTAWTGWKR